MQILMKVDSDFVVKYVNSWYQNGVAYIQMNYCKMNMLKFMDKKRAMFKREKQFAMSVVEFKISGDIFRDLLLCLQYLHEHEPMIIHLDLKPENILFDNKNVSFKLADFGLASIHSANKNKHAHAIGTQAYMAPEVNDGGEYNNKADIYSMGIIMLDLFDVDFFG
jgi:serine/threonine protein kinase